MRFFASTGFSQEHDSKGAKTPPASEPTERCVDAPLSDGLGDAESATLIGDRPSLCRTGRARCGIQVQWQLAFVLVLCGVVVVAGSSQVH